MALTRDALRKRIDAVPRVRLGHFPTPLEYLPRLTEAIGGPRILIKRDDCTGLAFGGNKTRQIEFTIAQGTSRGADVVIGGAGSQSNHCRQLSAAAAKLGLKAAIAVVKDHKSGGGGNLLLDDLLGAEVEVVEVETQEYLDEAKQKLRERFEAEGRKPFIVMQAVNRPFGAMGYALAVAEMADQADAMGERIDAIVTCSGSCTQPGIIFGNAAIGLGSRIYGIAPIEWTYDVKEAFHGVLSRMTEILDVDFSFEDGDIWNSADYIGPKGYAFCSEEGNAALRLMAETEGIILDPIYTGKALAGLIDLASKGELAEDETVVLVHTGGTPALFAYGDELMRKG